MHTGILDAVKVEVDWMVWFIMQVQKKKKKFAVFGAFLEYFFSISIVNPTHSDRNNLQAAKKNSDYLTDLD